MSDRYMDYRRLKNLHQKAEKDASSGGISFLNDFFFTNIAAPIHPILKNDDEGCELCNWHTTHDSILYPCTDRDDCVGCANEDETNLKKGIGIISLSYYHEVERRAFQGREPETYFQLCKGEYNCEECKAGKGSILGQKRVCFLPKTHFLNIVEMLGKTARTCAHCDSNLVPIHLMCPKCGATLLEAGVNGVTTEDIEEAFTTTARCRTHGIVLPLTVDVCMDESKRKVVCDVSKPGDPRELSMSVRKTTGDFPKLEMTSFKFFDFLTNNPHLDMSFPERSEFVPDWDAEMATRFIEARRKSRKKRGKKK